jgi:hypothetical protein
MNRKLNSDQHKIPQQSHSEFMCSGRVGRFVLLVTRDLSFLLQPVMNQKKDLLVITTNETNMWSFVKVSFNHVKVATVKLSK